MEAKALPVAIEQAVVGFLHEEIFTRFGIPSEIVTNGGKQLIQDSLDTRCTNTRSNTGLLHHITHKTTNK